MNSVKQTCVVPESIVIDTYDRFNEEDIARVVNIVKKETEGKLDDLEISKDDVINFVNVLLFKDQWNTSANVELYGDKTFYNRDNSKVKVPFIEGHMYYLTKTDLGEGFSVFYEMGSVLQVYMPNDMNKFLDSTEDIISSVLQELNEGDVATRDSKFYMPKFTEKATLKLKDSLINLLPTAFSSSADLSECFEGNIKVKDIRQNLFIDVNEDGTEAAAMTDISCKLNSCTLQEPEFITIDRPYIYVIEDVNRNILFAGIQNNFEK